MFTPAHPGQILKRVIGEELNIKISEASEKLGISRVALSRVVNARASISPELAMRLECAGISKARMWLKLQMNYDLAVLQSTPEASSIACEVERLVPEGKVVA